MRELLAETGVLCSCCACACKLQRGSACDSVRGRQALFEEAIQLSLQPGRGAGRLWYPYSYYAAMLARRAIFLVNQQSLLGGPSGSCNDARRRSLLPASQALLPAAVHRQVHASPSSAAEACLWPAFVRDQPGKYLLQQENLFTLMQDDFVAGAHIALKEAEDCLSTALSQCSSSGGARVLRLYR